jgi:hypothetical protein
MSNARPRDYPRRPAANPVTRRSRKRPVSACAPSAHSWRSDARRSELERARELVGRGVGLREVTALAPGIPTCDPSGPGRHPQLHRVGRPGPDRDVDPGEPRPPTGKAATREPARKVDPACPHERGLKSERADGPEGHDGPRGPTVTVGEEGVEPACRGLDAAGDDLPLTAGDRRTGLRSRYERRIVERPRCRTRLPAQDLCHDAMVGPPAAGESRPESRAVGPAIGHLTLR